MDTVESYNDRSQLAAAWNLGLRKYPVLSCQNAARNIVIKGVRTKT